MISSMPFPTLEEYVNRARADIAEGMPCISQQGPTHSLMVASETISAARFDDACRAFGAPGLVITANRARAVMSDAAAANFRVGGTAQNRNVLSVRSLKSGPYL